MTVSTDQGAAPESDSEWRKFRRGLGVQIQVIAALMSREVQSRYGRHNIGYLWIVAEPMMLASVMGGIHEAADLGYHAEGMHPFAFTLLGYCVFIIFRNVFNRADHVLDGSSFLLLHRVIKPLDIVVAKSIVEMVGIVCAFLLLMAFAISVGLSNVPVRPLYLFLAFGLMSWFTLSASIVVAAYTYDSHLLSRFIHPFSYFMIPLSGAFFTVSFLPPWARDIMVWNPMVAIFEIARYGQFRVASDEYLYAGYVVGFCAFLTYWGMIALRQVAKKIHVS